MGSAPLSRRMQRPAHAASFVPRARAPGRSSQLQQLWDLAHANRTSPAGSREEYIAAIELQIAECEEREMQHIDQHDSL